MILRMIKIISEIMINNTTLRCITNSIILFTKVTHFNIFKTFSYFHLEIKVTQKEGSQRATLPPVVSLPKGHKNKARPG